MSDLVERLRRIGSERQRTTAHDNPQHYLHVVAKISNADGLLMIEAADRIAQLEAALREIAKVTRGWEPGVWSEKEGRQYFAALFFSAQKVARATLGEERT